MPEEKPVHISKDYYPEIAYPVAPPSTHFYGGEGGDEVIHLGHYWNVILSRKWTVIAVLVSIVTITMIATFQQTPVYRAETTIQIDRENQNVLAFKDVVSIDTLTDDTLQTQYKILAARTLARRVVEQLKLDQKPEFYAVRPTIASSLVKSVKAYLTNSDTSPAGEPDKLRVVIDNYLSKLTPTPVPKSRLIKVSFDSEDPKLAMQILNQHAHQFIEQNLQYKFDATQLASSFLSDQTQGLKANLEKAEDTLQKYGQENEILFTEEGKNTATERLQSLESEYIKVQSDRIQKEVLENQIKADKTETLPQLMTNSLLAQMTAQLSTLRQQDSNLAVTFEPNYVDRQKIGSQIAELERAITALKKRVVESVHTEYLGSVEREKAIAKELDAQRKTVNTINQQIIHYNLLKGDVDSNKQVYDGLLTRLKEAGVSAGLRASNIRVVDAAEVPQAPVKPQKGLNFLLSMLAGLITGVGLAFFQEYMDSTLKSADDVRRSLHIPVLAVVPALSSVAAGRGYQHYAAEDLKLKETLAKLGKRQGAIELLMHTSPLSLMAEAYRSLRTSLLLSAPDHPPRSILITSSVPSEGKTVTATNLAISLTQSGARTLLVDADMRKPRIHAVFDLSEDRGLSNFLTGTANLKDTIHETAIQNLFIMPCGPIPPNPGELVLSDRFRQMIGALREYFDYIIVDSPPLSNVSDGRVLANACEAVILVVKSTSTSRTAAQRAVDHLSESRARIAGAVLNDVDVRARTGDYAYYQYSRQYGRYANK